MKQPHSISVTSHVGRDLLQSAAIFKNEDAVIWEYVVNSIQYVDRGTTPKVQVIVHPRKKEIEIHDNRTTSYRNFRIGNARTQKVVRLTRIAGEGNENGC